MARGRGEWCFTQRKDGLWTARKQFGFKTDGKKNIVAFYGKTKTIVKNKAAEYEKKLNENRAESTKKITVYEYVLEWMENFKKFSVKPSTYDGMEDTLNVRLKPYDISSIQMNNLSVDLCQTYINQLTKSEKKYSMATIRKAYNLLNACFKHAVGVGDITKNPMQFVQMPSVESVQTKEKEIQYFNEEQVKEIISEATKEWRNGVPIHRYGYVICLLIFTGMRIGECLGLRWCDVDFENKQLTIDNTILLIKNRNNKDNDRKKRITVDTSPKTKKSIRTIKLSQNAIKALYSIKSMNEYYGVKTRDNDYVVVSKKGTHATARNVSRTLGDILENCSFTDKEKKYGLHSLRHTFASLLLAKGADIKSISEILGHEKTSTTYDIYAHLIADQKNTAIDLLDTI